MFTDMAGDIPIWVYLTTMSVAILVIGISKGGFGGGTGILAVPLTASVLPADRAMGILLPLLIVTDLFANAAHLRHQSRPHLRWLVVGAIVGVAAGTVLIATLHKGGELVVGMNLFIGLVCLVLVALQCYRLVGGHVPRIPPGPWGGRSTGMLAGFTSTLAHAAGPLISIYLLEQRMDKRRLVGTMVVYFLLINLAKVPTYVVFGLIDAQTLLEGLWLLPLIPLGVLMGLWMHKRIPEKPFVVIMYLAAAVTSANMLYQGVQGLR